MSDIYDMPKTPAAAKEWVESGKPCTFRYGWDWKGARSHPITQDEARQKLEKHHFGMGFYSLFWETYEGQTVLCFNELSESDMY